MGERAPSDQEILREEFVHLVDLSHDRVLLAWGAFWFRRDEAEGRWTILDDSELHEAVGRRSSIGHEAEPFGGARVEVLDASGDVVAEASTATQCWVWVEGLEPDTEYRYRIHVDGQEWAAGERWDWVPTAAGGYDLGPGKTYDLVFRTFPDPETESPSVRFVAMGDYGVGIRSDSESSRRQRRVGDVLDELVRNHDVRFVLSLGDNIYQGEMGQVDDESGGEDDDWYSSFFQPYRYVIARIPVFPAIGNHDTTDSEGSDDRAQMEDNFHVSERFKQQQDRASLGPGLFYRFRYGSGLELICVDTSEDSDNPDYHRFFQAPDHKQWLEEALAEADPTWRIPFSHHPVYCAGPSHDNDAEMLETLLPLYERGGVRLVLAGHEHNFQVSEVDGRTFVVSGAAGQLREETPEWFEEAHTTAWAAQAHLLLVEIEGAEARLTPISGLLPDGSLHVMTALNPRNEVVRPPIVVRQQG
ncbi:MAG TPA: metallophosphoesterase [Jiangellaceae bacterium]